MATMTIDYGDGTQATIRTPDRPGEVETSDRTKELSRWLSSGMEGALQRRSIIDKLEKQGWERTIETRPLFDKLLEDVNTFKGSPLASRSEDFYDWINRSPENTLLAGNTVAVIERSPDAVVNRALVHWSADSARALPRIDVFAPGIAVEFKHRAETIKPKGLKRIFKRKTLLLEDKSKNSEPDDSDLNELDR